MFFQWELTEYMILFKDKLDFIKFKKKKTKKKTTTKTNKKPPPKPPTITTSSQKLILSPHVFVIQVPEVWGIGSVKFLKFSYVNKFFFFQRETC